MSGLEQFPYDLYKDPRMQAAYEIAREAHKGQMRHDGTPYIRHPLMVYAMLDRLGANDVQKAVGLLHDVLEDSPKIKDRDMLEKELYDRIVREICDDDSIDQDELIAWVRDVVEGVQQLTNDVIIYEDKRTWQADHVSAMPDIYKPIKIIDQAASVLDDILNKDPGGKEGESVLAKEIRFARKAHDVAENCKSPLYPQYTKFFDLVYIKFEIYREKRRLKHVHKLVEFQENFNWEELFEQANDSDTYLTQTHTDDLTHVIDGNFLRKREGLLRVSSNRDRQITGYGIIVNLNGDETDPVNRLYIDLRAALEAELRVNVASGRLDLERKFHYPIMMVIESGQGIAVRDFKIEPAVSMSQFLRIARDVGAIDEQFLRQNRKVMYAHRNTGRER